MSLLTFALTRLQVVFFFVHILWVFYLITYYTTKNTSETNPKYEHPEEDYECQIPVLEPFVPTFPNVSVDAESYRCHSDFPDIIQSNLTSIYVANNISLDRKKLTCCYRPFFRLKPPNSTANDFWSLISSKCRPFKDSANIKDEFISVTCKYGSDETPYKKYIAFVPHKNTTRNSLVGTTTKKLYNILILGIDSCSRMCLYRHMPKTLDYVKKNLSMVEFETFQKVGENTFPNIIGLLTGDDVEALRRNCWASSDKRFDDCKRVFIWKKLRSAGYLTSHAEESSKVGTFHYGKKGFYEPPTDYWWHTFDVALEEELGRLPSGIKALFNICVGGSYVHKILMEYTMRLAESIRLRNQSYHAIHWFSSLSHETNKWLKFGDADFADFFHELNVGGFLEDTVLVFMSDHGLRFGDYRKTPQGSLEERLPFLFLRLPETFKRQHPNAFDNIKKNSKRLVTTFDLYQTQLDIMNHDKLENATEKPKPAKSMSLFKPIPPKRNCRTAGVDPSSCACNTLKKINPNYPTVLKATITALNHINQKLLPHRNCSRLKLHRTISASITSATFKNISVYKSHFFQEYRVMFETKPGTGVFEATVRRYPNRLYEIMGYISRVSAYGNESDCISDYKMKLYCYCKNFAN